MPFMIALQVGSSTQPITLVDWKAKEGDWVEKETVILEVEGENTRHKIEAQISGFLHILAKEGSQMPIGSVAGIIGSSREESKSLRPGVIGTEEEASPEELAPEGYEGKRVRSSSPLTGMRKAIGEHMLRSLSVSAQLTEMGEIDMSEMVKLRKALVSKENIIGTRITYADLMIVVLSKILRDHPLMNASIIDNEVKIWEDVNISVAVALEEGLIVPVIRNADNKSLVEISQAVKTLTNKARERKLAPEEIKGGTFTISNWGAVSSGWRLGTPIINQPQSAILATGSIIDRAVVRSGEIVIRPIMTHSLTYDHRLIDGDTGSRFMTDVIRLMENPQVLDLLPANKYV